MEVCSGICYKEDKRNYKKAEMLDANVGGPEDGKGGGNGTKIVEIVSSAKTFATNGAFSEHDGIELGKGKGFEGTLIDRNVSFHCVFCWSFFLVRKHLILTI